MIPAVSVVIATRNYGRYLAGALRSVLAQTHSDLEVIVVDDGSTDDTPVVVRPYLSDPRISYHRTDGLGQPRAKNLGVRHARGPLIAFLDGDDEWRPTKLERQLPLFQDPAVGVVYSRRTTMGPDGNELPTTPTELVRGRVFEAVLIRNCVCFSSVVVRRDVFEAVGLFDPKLPLAIDYDLWLRVARHYTFDYVDEPLVRYRTGHANLSSRLSERVGIVLGIVRRALNRRGGAEDVTAKAIAESWASPCRALAYVTRQSSPMQAIPWYARAARHDGRWLHSLRGMAGALIKRSR